MWLDNASEVDILFYEPYANVIADISKNPKLQTAHYRCIRCLGSRKVNPFEVDRTENRCGL